MYFPAPYMFWTCSMPGLLLPDHFGNNNQHRSREQENELWVRHVNQWDPSIFRVLWLHLQHILSVWRNRFNQIQHHFILQHVWNECHVFKPNIDSTGTSPIDWVQLPPLQWNRNQTQPYNWSFKWLDWLCQPAWKTWIVAIGLSI